MHAPLKRHRVLLLNSIAKNALKHLADGCDYSDSMEDPQAILVRSSKVDLGKYPSVIALGRAGVGVDNIPVDLATERGIPVFFAPGANANSVVELFFTLYGMHARKVATALDYVAKLHKGLTNDEIHKRVEADKKVFAGFETCHHIVGVVGLGNIGRLVARRALERYMSVVGYDPGIPADARGDIDNDVQWMPSLEKTAKQVDVLTVHVDLNPKTRGLINAKIIGEMKDGAVLANLSRDAVCEEDAVLAALESGKLSCFITDFPTQRIIGHPKILATPHLGASTEDAEERSGNMAAKALGEYLKYGTVENSKNFPTMDVMPKPGIRMRLAIPHRNVPDMIGRISHTLGEQKINIGSMHNETKQGLGYMVVDLDQPARPEQLEPIANLEDVLKLRVLEFAV